jgi:hypothetical protein
MVLITAVVKATAGGYGVYSSGNAHVEGNLTWKSKTSYIAVSAAAFRPQADGYDFTNLGCYVTNMDSASDIYEAPVQLPHGATVTGMTFYWLDGSALEDGHCYLKRNDLAGGNVTMALANTSGSSGTPDSSQAPSISYATIDN